MAKRNNDIKTESFADGLKRFNTKGGYCRPARLNKKTKAMLLALIEEYKYTVIPNIDDNSYECLDEFLSAMKWMEDKIKKEKSVFITIRMSKKIALHLLNFVIDNKYNHFAVEDEKTFENATQWVTNQWNKYYAQSQLIK